MKTDLEFEEGIRKGKIEVVKSYKNKVEEVVDKIDLFLIHIKAHLKTLKEIDDL